MVVNLFSSYEILDCKIIIYRQLLPPRGWAGGRIGTRFHRPRGTSPLKEANTAGTLGYKNWTESFFGLKGRSSDVRDV
jgi:hypothetical protein